MIEPDPCYPYSFSRVYAGKGCSVYEVRNEGFLRGRTSWTAELVCESEVAVEREIVVDNLYDDLLQAQQRGDLILHRYTDSAACRKLISEHIVDRLIRFDALDHLETDVRFQKHYRRIINALREVMGGAPVGERLTHK